MNNSQVGRSSCFRLIEQKLKTYTFEKLKKLANVYNIKIRRRDYKIDDLAQKYKNYISYQGSIRPKSLGGCLF